MTLRLPDDLRHLGLVENAPTLFERAWALFCPIGCHRYGLGRIWNESRSVVVWIMLNPSVADAFRLDPTVERCRRRAESWMAGGIVVLNAFGLRSTNPDALRDHGDPVGCDNDTVVRWLLGPASPYTVARVILGWGTNGTLVKTGRDQDMLALLGELGVRPACLKRTKAGHPQHPLYVGYEHQPVPFTG